MDDVLENRGATAVVKPTSDQLDYSRLCRLMGFRYSGGQECAA